jgi:hypothetical protein
MNRLSEQSGTGPTASPWATSTWLNAGWRWREADTAAVGQGSSRRARQMFGQELQQARLGSDGQRHAAD